MAVMGKVSPQAQEVNEAREALDEATSRLVYSVSRDRVEFFMNALDRYIQAKIDYGTR